ncbi:hypothetical protein EJ03DRAFT_355666 [Teratosphaeria nubilosa]|uniref:Uncharacterized protein n=1 Tax=Teratosphaeria nubilosa TaxID=161662 RepID=A0A6G1KWI1_9PEZI|nr:hypothetical protein EJ03DRAFT_355666 [Teratosphaeria nubilosa]
MSGLRPAIFLLITSRLNRSRTTIIIVWTYSPEMAHTCTSTKATAGSNSTNGPVVDSAPTQAAQGGNATGNAAHGIRNAAGTANITEHNLRIHNRIMEQTSGNSGNASYSVQRWLTDTDDTFVRQTEAPGWAELVARNELAAVKYVEQ